jgi:hypothetical protein
VADRCFQPWAGSFCSIGSSAVVLLGGEMGDKATLGSLSLVMRHESLPANTTWHGLPAQPALTHAASGDDEAGLEAGHHDDETPGEAHEEEEEAFPREKVLAPAEPGLRIPRYNVTVVVKDPAADLPPVKGTWARAKAKASVA